ncbi:hypothetical protein ES703_114042 [subsurface metagenome]
MSELDEKSLPLPPILPICEVIHDRLAIEVMRGCTWGCRFCQAGYVNRPLRIRPEQDILKAIEKGIRQTGWEEISLVSFTILDYPDLLNLIRKLNEILKKKMINISLPAMRGELFSEEIAILLKEIKKTGLTFAPETASEKLRCRLNKPFSNEKLISSINTAYKLGWKHVKLYFMVGLPFEKNDDIAEIDTLVGQILEAYPKGSIKLSGYASNICPTKVSISAMSSFFSRADDKSFPVIESVYKQGGKFEEWREGFDFSRWQAAFEATGVDPKKYLKPKDKYPWDFIDIGVEKDFLKQELIHAQNAVTTENCYYEHCSNCGACDGKMDKYQQKAEKYVCYGRYPKRKARPISYRVKYTIGESFRYASHLDITRTIYRSLRRSDLPIQFTQGFSPIPKVSFCPPKSVGQVAKGDFFDFYLDSEYFGNISIELNARFPSGIRILEVRAIPVNTPSLSNSINLIYYEVNLPQNDIKKSLGFSSDKPIYIKTKSGMKNILDGLESISLNNGILTCGLYFGIKKINIYELLSYLTNLLIESAKIYKITRTTMFIKKGGILHSPMEVK